MVARAQGERGDEEEGSVAMKIREFADWFMRGEPLTMTLRDPEGREFTAEYVLVRSVSRPAYDSNLKNEPCTLELVLTGPELEI